MVLRELVPLVLLGLVFYLAVTRLGGAQRSGPADPAPALPVGPFRWTPTHYAADHRTHVVVRKVAVTGAVLDEHLIATLPEDDPDYDARFLEAMATARGRAALYQSEE